MKRIYCLLPVFLVILGLFTSCAPPNAAKKKTSTSAVTVGAISSVEQQNPCLSGGTRSQQLFTIMGNFALNVESSNTIYWSGSVINNSISYKVARSND
ncbi:MAG: hypothetical protein WCG27_12110, partial [Pseudomonadota bacterium]